MKRLPCIFLASGTRRRAGGSRRKKLHDLRDPAWTGHSDLDAGGGGTIAYILAEYGMNVIDSGVAVLNMHSPCEVISKADLYESLRGYIAFLENMDFCNE